MGRAVLLERSSSRTRPPRPRTRGRARAGRPRCGRRCRPRSRDGRRAQGAAIGLPDPRAPRRRRCHPRPAPPLRSAAQRPASRAEASTRTRRSNQPASIRAALQIAFAQAKPARGAHAVSVGRASLEAAPAGGGLVEDDRAGLVPSPAAPSQHAVEQVHVESSPARRAGPQALVAAADSVEPLPAQREVVAAADLPGGRAAAELAPPGAPARGHREGPVARPRER